MRIAVISEVSAGDKNGLIIDALKFVDAKVYNVGMSDEPHSTELTYIHTGLMAGLSLATGAADFVVGGCGTGQGFLLSAMQYPGVFCGHIIEPVDAWLFSQINGGNCVSLALNKGFGWAGGINLKYIFEKLFCDEPGAGFPLHRSESQRQSRQLLSQISAGTHKDFVSILNALDCGIVQTVRQHKPFIDFITQFARDGELKSLLLSESD